MVSLLVDGLTAIKETCINNEVHNNKEYTHYKKLLSWEYMDCFSTCSLIFSILGMTYYIVFTDFLDYCGAFLYNSEFLLNMFSVAIFTALGQIFVFQTIEKYGPLTLCIITGVRKLLSIAVSIIYFNKEVGLFKVVALGLGSSIIVWEIIEKTKSGKKSSEKVEKLH